MSSTAELATSYAALILADDGIDITVRRPVANPRATPLGGGEEEFGNSN